MADEKKKKDRTAQLRKWAKPLLWALVVLAAFVYAFQGSIFGSDTHRLSQAELLEKARLGQVAEVTYTDDTHLTVKLKGDTRKWEVTYPKAIASDTMRRLNDANVPLKPEKETSYGSSFIRFLSVLFWVWLVFGVIVPLVKKGFQTIQGKTTKVKSCRPKERLKHVKGMPEVVAEAEKIVDAITNPERYAKLGSRLPAGLVLYGKPGTGKTLLAKAIAGEADVPFYEITGSAIRSKWVGDSAKAIRAYFEKARKDKVSIIFFDEGDTIGGRRGDGEGGGDREHRATVNELLAQINHNSPNGHVVMIIANNDPELLDEALTRPGRIDLKLEVLPPDVNGRKAILEAHTKDRPLADDVDLTRLAKETYGSTGADIEGLVNNASLHAGSRGADAISCADFDHALTVMRTGPALKSQHVNEDDKVVTAYHEAGHTLPAMVLDLIADPTSVTVLAHAGSGGHTLSIPDEEKMSKYLRERAAKQRLIQLMSGVVGEKLALDNDFTNGAASDRQQATELATLMVCKWGMGTYNSTFGRHWETGAHADEVRAQIEELLDEAERAAIELILTYKDDFDALVDLLLAQETLRADDLALFEPRPVNDHKLKAIKQHYQGLVDSVRRSDSTQASNSHRRNIMTV